MILWYMLPVRRAATFSATSDEMGSTTDAVRDVTLTFLTFEGWLCSRDTHKGGGRVGRHRVVTRREVLAGGLGPARAKADGVPLAENEIGQPRACGLGFCLESSSPDWRRGG